MDNPRFPSINSMTFSRKGFCKVSEKMKPDHDSELIFSLSSSRTPHQIVAILLSEHTVTFLHNTPLLVIFYTHLWASLVAQLVKNLLAMQETEFDSWVGKIPWRRKWQPTLVFLPGESHGQRSLVGSQAMELQESDTT